MYDTLIHTKRCANGTLWVILLAVTVVKFSPLSAWSFEEMFIYIVPARAAVLDVLIRCRTRRNEVVYFEIKL